MKEISIRDAEKEALDRFDCGQEALNVFLRSYARQNDERGLGKTFLLLEESKVNGYYTLSSAQIEFASLPSSLSKRLPRYPIPAIRIARLAVDQSEQGKGVGATLIKSAFKRIVLASSSAGVAFAVVDAKEEAIPFYEHFGFVRLGEGNVLALPIATILKSIIA